MKLNSPFIGIFSFFETLPPTRAALVLNTLNLPCLAYKIAIESAARDVILLDFRSRGIFLYSCRYSHLESIDSRGYSVYPSWHPVNYCRCQFVRAIVTLTYLPVRGLVSSSDPTNNQAYMNQMVGFCYPRERQAALITA